MRCDLDFFSPEWDEVSKYAKDFVSALIVLDPAGRLSAREALAHPWVKGVGVRGRHMGTTLDNIAEFNAKRKTKGGVFALMAATGLMNRVKTKNKNNNNNNDDNNNNDNVNNDDNSNDNDNDNNNNIENDNNSSDEVGGSNQ